MPSFKTALIAAVALGNATLAINTVSAMPAAGLAVASNKLSNDLQNIRWVCGWYRCQWHPSSYYLLYPFVYYGKPHPRYWGMVPGGEIWVVPTTILAPVPFWQ
jgi:hypothetical protein